MKIDNWVFRSVGPKGEVGSERFDRLCNKEIIKITENMAIKLPKQYNYMIFYFDDNNVLIRKRSLRGDRIFTILLLRGENIRIYVAAQTGSIDISLFNNLFLKVNVDYELSDILKKNIANKIKLIGDSITAGFGGSGYANTGKMFISNGNLTQYENLYGICWANFLKYRLKKEKNIDVDNYGCSKYTSMLLLLSLDKLIKEDDEFIICMIGTNDRLIKDDDLISYRDRILSIISYCLLQNKKIIMMSCVPSSEESKQTVNYTLEEESKIIKDVCAKLNIPFINMYKGFLDELCLSKFTLDDCLNDGLHPNDLGYYLMYRFICKTLNLNVELEDAVEIENNKQVNIAYYGNCLYYSAKNNEIVISYLNEKEQVIFQETLPNLGFKKVFLENNKFIIDIKGNIENLPFTPYYEKFLIPIQPENVGERNYYEYLSNKIFNDENLKEHWNISKLLMWDIIDINGNKIDFKIFADNILKGNIVLNTRQVLKVSPSMWDQSFSAVARSSKLQQFSLYWITLLLEQYQLTQNKEYLDAAENQISNFIKWLDDDYSKLGLSVIPSAEHAYAIRCIVFANALCVFPKNWQLRHEVLVLLMQHCEWLRNLKVKILNNHGLIMLEGIMHVANMLVDQPQNSKCYKNILIKHIEDRLIEIYNANFDEDGCAKENTIGYHVFNIKCIEEIINFSKILNIPIDCQKVQENLSKCKLVTKQMIFQNSKIPPIGDSAALNLSELSVNKSYYYKNAGWVIIKNDNKYISFKSGMSSEAHKHVDDNSLLFRFAGRDILIDSGMYNYDRDDPIRQYCESARGHSSLYPVSLYNVLSPEYCRSIFESGGIKFFIQEENNNSAQGYYLLKNGFYAERNIKDIDGLLIINDSFRSKKSETVDLRFCLHPDTKVLARYDNIFLFRNNELYFTIDIQSAEDKENIFFDDGYYSEYANEAANNKVLVLRIKNKNFSNIKTQIRYGLDINTIIKNLFVSTKIINNELIVNCIGKKMAEYNYYLYYNNLCIEKIENIQVSNCNFNIAETGEYYVTVGYREHPHSPIKFLNSEVVSIKRRKISIFGSCVSRDIFEFDKLNQFELCSYIARQSIFSAVSNPVNFTEEAIHLTSPFQKRMLLMDLHKNTFEKLKADDSEYLLIDLIDERFSLIKCNESFCTASNEFINGISKFFEPIKLLNKNIKNGNLFVGQLPVDNLVDEFCSRISDIYKSEHIILHKAKMVDYYMTLDGNIEKFTGGYLKNNKYLNKILDYMYSRIEKNLPGINVIDEMEGTVASEKHKWGLAPMHYEEDYYYRVLTKILKIIK